MFFGLYDLYQEMSNYNKIYIYGVGMYSEMIVPKLHDMGLKEKIAGYVVSNKEQEELYKDGVPIYDIDSLRINVNEYIFLIATSSKFEYEIETNLKKHNYTKYIFLSDYERQNFNVYFKFNNISYNQYCKHIIEWYEYKNSQRLRGNFEKEYIKIKEVMKHKRQTVNTQNNNQIVFVVAALYPRIHKIIGALVNKCYDIVVLDMVCSDYPYSQYKKEKNVRIIYCECIEEVLFEAAKYTPLIFYVRPALLDTSIANIMIKYRELYGKIVLDIHDIAKGVYNLTLEKQWLYEIEKDALENVDGIVWRYDAESFLKEKYGYQFRGKSIQFWDYCYDEFIFNEIEGDEILKLCCIDSGAECLMPPDDEELCLNGIVRYANIHDILHKIENRADCNFDLYISKISDEELEELNKLKKEFVNFNFFIGYSPQKIIHNISKCDYGCSFYHPGRVPTDEECTEKGYFRLAGTYEVTATNRDFDFLNAGIPIVTSYEGKKQKDYLKKFGVIVDMSLEDLDIDYLKKNRDGFRENVKKAQPQLAISNNIDRLIVFFKDVSEE